jgi:hypothetical protein
MGTTGESETGIPAALRLEPDVRNGAAGSAADLGTFALYEEVKGWLERQAAAQPVLIVLEDLHWADTASVRLLRHLTGGAGVSGLLLLATSRDENASPALVELLAEAARSPIAVRIHLEHLDRQAVAELVSALKGEAVPPHAAEMLFERSGGNPFFLTELVRLGSAGRDAVPEGVRAVIARRVGQLSDPSREMLRAAACLPDEIDLGLLADVLHRAQSEVLDLIDEALAMRLLKESPDRTGWLQFPHPLLRDAVNAGMAASRRAVLHRRVAEAIGARPGGRPGALTSFDDGTVAALAHHYSEAAISGTVREAASWSREAAVRELARGAAEDARDRMLRTLNLVGRLGVRDDPMVVDLLIVLGRSQRHVGVDTGRPVIGQAMSMARRLDDPGRVVEAALVLNTDTWSFTSTFGQADEQLMAHLWWALPRWGLNNPPGAVAAAYVLANELIFADGQVEGVDKEVPGAEAVSGAAATGLGRADALTRRALELARDSPDRRVMLLALQSRWLAIWGPETLEERQSLVDQMQSLVSQRGLDRTRPLILAWATALEAADRARTHAIVEAAADMLAEAPNPGLRVFVRWRRSLRAILDGRFDQAEALISAAYEETSRFHPHEAFDAYSGQLAAVFWLNGRMGELELVLARAMVDQPYLTNAFGSALALAQISAGRPEEARATLGQLQLTNVQVTPAAMSRSGSTATFAVAAAELGDPDLVATALRFLGPPGSSSPAIVDHVGVFYLGARAAHRGRVQLSAGRVQEAVVSLDEGLAVDSRMGAVPFVIKDQIDLARALMTRNRADDLPRAAELLRAAGRAAEAHGMTADAGRAAKLAATTARAPAS